MIIPANLLVYRIPHVSKSTMDFILKVLLYSLKGEIECSDYMLDLYSSEESHAPDRRFYFNEDDIKAVESFDDAWDLVETGILLWSEMINAFQETEPRELILGAVKEHYVIVSFGERAKSHLFSFPTDLHHISYLEFTRDDHRFAGIVDHTQWIAIALKIVSEYLKELRQRVDGAQSLYERLLIAEGGSAELRGAINTSGFTTIAPGSSPPQSAFRSVSKYFVSTPEEVLRIIRTNEGTVKLRRLLLKEAALLLEPLKEHFKLERRLLYGAKIHIEGLEPFHWFDGKRRLYNNLKYYRNSTKNTGSRSELETVAAQFQKDLQQFLPRS